MPKIVGVKRWSMTRDMDYNRDYSISILVELDFPLNVFTGSSLQGPAIVSNTPGLPVIGDTWNFADDVDVWAYCKARTTIEQFGNDVPNQYFLVTYLFSTKPDRRCNETAIEDPLLEPPKLSGSFTKYTLEATQDRFGNPILTSSFEQIRGPQNEWDANRQTVKIAIPVAQLNLQTVSSCMDTVNEFELWGNSPRCVKLSNASWEQVFFGTCYVYYRWEYEFEVNSDTWDRDFLDQGTKALHGENRQGNWVITPINVGLPAINPDPTNPLHFVQYTDVNSNPTPVILNGFGIPITQVGPQVNPVTTTNAAVTINYGVSFTLPVTSSANFPTGISPSNPGTMTIMGYLETTPTQGPIPLTISFTGVSGNNITGCTLVSSNYNQLFNYSIPFQQDINVSSHSSPGYIHVEKYNESDFVTQLGIPSVLDPYSGL